MVKEKYKMYDSIWWKDEMREILGVCWVEDTFKGEEYSNQWCYLVPSVKEGEENKDQSLILKRSMFGSWKESEISFDEGRLIIGNVYEWVYETDIIDPLEIEIMKMRKEYSKKKNNDKRI